MRSPHQKRKNQHQEEPQLLVRHVGKNQPGVLIQKSQIHEDFFIVLSEGSLQEWHISNIDGLW